MRLHRPAPRPARHLAVRAAIVAACLGASACSSEHLLGSSDPSTPPSVPDLGAPGTKDNPSYGTTAQQADPPPAISGGTLAVLQQGLRALAADPDRDRLYLVDLVGGTVEGSVALQAGDEPGRVVEDGAGRAHVALRRGGALVDVDPGTRTVLSRRPACASPRGLAYDAARDLVWLACVDGELLGFPAAGGAATRSFQPATDLRDVVVSGDRLFVSRFRSAEVITVDVNTGAVLARQSPAVLSAGTESGPAQLAPAVAWRLIDGGAQGPLLLHQRAVDGEVMPAPGGYGGSGGCPPAIVTTAITRFGTDGPTSGPVIAGAPLPVDFAYAGGSTIAAFVAAGNARRGSAPSVASVVIDNHLERTGCEGMEQEANVTLPGGQATAIAFRPSGQLVVQQREPAALLLIDGPQITATIPLDATSRRDTGHDVFHLATAAGLACASCHPEGGDDGRVWTFAKEGPRRTFSLRGGVMERLPFHWSGSLPTLEALLADVMVGRMSGPLLAGDQQAALAHWLEALPSLPAPVGEAAAVARGQAIFESAGAACTTCHAGTQLSSNQVASVGTGGSFKVPSLRGLAQRDPYLHDGSATTLRDRFTRDTRRLHGGTAQLDAAQIDDLIAYLQSR